MIFRFRATPARVMFAAVALLAGGVSAAHAAEPAAAPAPAAATASPLSQLLDPQDHGVPIAAATGIPTPAATTLPQRRRASIPRFEYSVSGVDTRFTGNDVHNTAAGTDRLGLNFTYHLSPKWLIFANRGNLDYQLGRTEVTSVVAGHTKETVTIPALAEDFIDTEGVRYALGDDGYVGAGHYRRWHECCPASGAIGNLNPSVESSVYAEVQEAFGPTSVIGHAFTVYAMGEIPHRVLSPLAFPAKTLDTYPLVPPETLPTLKYFDFFFRFPIYHQNRVVPFIRLSETTTEFDSAVLPTQASYVMYGLDFRGSSQWSYQINQRNYTGHVQAQPGAFAHYTWVQFSATYRGRLGKLPGT